MVRRRNWVGIFAGACAILLICFFAAVLVGSRPVSLSRAFQGLAPDREILIYLRIPRALLALWAGGALSLSGVLFQALLRESLAEAYTLGVSGGASLGAVFAICFGWTAFGGVSAVCLAAFVGAAVVLGVVVLIASEGGRMSSMGLLLAGITVNSICAAVILFLSNLSGFMQSFAITRWMVGGLDAPSYPSLVGITIVLLPVCFLVFWRSREWNVLALGEDWATTRGVSTSKLLLLGCLSGSVLTGTITALTGPISFVGLIVPHATRLWVGADHRILIPVSFLIGASFLALSDVLSRTVLAPVEVPVGVITAFLGGPFFIWLLRRRTRRLPS
ncbi:MAG: FecCD family ABC transporter permease [Bryobacteraceae bacterium]